MEKCTYCTQRIAAERIKAKNAWAKAGGRDGGGQLELPNGDAAVPIADGTIVPACGQACSTDAIVFGDLRDENSRVAQLFRNERTYQMLEELHVVLVPNTSPKSETPTEVALRATGTVITGTTDMVTTTTATTGITTTMVTTITTTERRVTGIIDPWFLP